METQQIYQFKITLKGSKPPIWRRVQVPGYYTFDGLHGIIQGAMGWIGYHLNQFEMKGPMGWKVIIGDKDNDEFDIVDVSSETATIAEYFTAPKDKATYTYDFGDNWQHNVVLEKILPASEDVDYPKCTAGARACPPEDCGGIYGYKSFMEIMANPQHEEHKDMKEWYQGVTGSDEQFAPEKFDLESTNNQMW